MTTKQYLNQIKRFDVLIENKASEIEQLRAMATSITVATDSERVQTSGDKDRVGRAVAKIIDKENELNDLLDDCYDTRENIISQIESMETKYYQLLFYKYVNSYTMDIISEKMHYSLRRTKQIHADAIQKFEDKYGHIYANTMPYEYVCTK